MDNHTRQQTGSPSRDQFKRLHKKLSRDLYGCDIDFVFVTKVPTPDIIAALDYKQDGDGISFSEVIAYNSLVRRGIPVFIVTGEAAAGEFRIERYTGGHHGKPKFTLEHVCDIANWQEFEQWERSLRKQYMATFGC
jgi:hypothetical protein